jgi:hypothetical protein
MEARLIMSGVRPPAPTFAAKEILQTGSAPADTVSVTISILLSLALLPPPSAPPLGSLPGVVEPRSGAWAVVHAGQLWVCWRAAPDCWRRVELDDAGDLRVEAYAFDEWEEPDDADADAVIAFDEPFEHRATELGPERWRLGFDAAAHLWIERDEQRWRVEHGQPRARLADDSTPVRLVSPRSSDCGPDGQRPAISGGRLGWEAAPRCADPPPPGATCVVPATTLRPRKSVPVRLRAGLEIGVVRGWTAVDPDATTPTVASVRPSAGVQLLFVLELGFDATRTNADARARAALQRRDRVRPVPAPMPSPVAAAEQAALIAAVCGGAP